MINLKIFVEKNLTWSNFLHSEEDQVSYQRKNKLSSHSEVPINWSELYLVAIGFLILEGDNLYTLFPIEGFEIIGSKIEGKQIFVIIVGLIIVPTVLLNDMSIHSYISASGVLASTILLGSILWTGVYDGIGFHEKGRLLNWSGLPTAVSLYAFCYCTHPVFPTLYTSMRKKSEFSKVKRRFQITKVVLDI